MDGVIFFDIDGTLTWPPSSSSAGYLAERTGNAARVAEAEAGYGAGRLSNQQVCDVDAAGFAGVSVEQVAAWLEDLPVIEGVAEAVRYCSRRGLYPVLASLAWRPVSESLARRFGFHVSGGPELEAAQGIYTGGVARYFDEFDKRDCAAQAAARFGLDLQHAVAVGDSRSDLPLFERVGASIALNASPRCIEAASVSLETGDLRDVLPLVDALLTPRPA